MKDWVFHDSHDIKYRAPFGAVEIEKPINLRLKLTTKSEIETVILHVWKDTKGRKKEIEMEIDEIDNEDVYYQATISSPTHPELLWYYFEIAINGGRFYYGNNVQGTGGVGLLTEHVPRSYQITVHKNTYLPPNWFKDAIIYQIFVDRFYNGNDDGSILNPKKNSLLHLDWDNDPIYIKDNSGSIIYWDFFGGNLIGVKKKLGYLKELGIKVIYFNPIFEAPSNHKYDTGNYHKIDSMFGDNQLFKELVEEANDLGMQIILDGVFSHTGSDSVYFNKEGNYKSIGACQSKDSPYYTWYRFIEYPTKYESWWGIGVLPNVNELEPSYQDFIIYGGNSVLKYWQRLGVKGWRLDVADELPDQFIKAFNKTMKKADHDAVLIGEVWEDASNKISYGVRRKYLINDELDSVTNYPFRKNLIDFILGHQDASTTHYSLMSLYENYPSHHFYSMMNIIGTHDTPRILTILQHELPNYLTEAEKQVISLKRLKLISLWQMTFPGVPCILYGDEAGLEGGEEPLNRRTYPWGRENTDLLNWYKRIISIRNQYDVFRTGTWLPFYYGNDVFGYARTIANETDMFGQKKKDNLAFVLINRSLHNEVNISLNIKKWDNIVSLVDIIEDNKVLQVIDGQLNLTLKPLEGKVLIQTI